MVCRAFASLLSDETILRNNQNIIPKLLVIDARLRESMFLHRVRQGSYVIFDIPTVAGETNSRLRDEGSENLTVPDFVAY